MMKRTLATILWAALMTAVVVGPAKLWLDVRAAQEVARDAYEDARSIPQAFAAIRVQLQDVDRKVFDLEEARLEIAARIEQTRKNVEKYQRELGDQKVILAETREMLAGDRQQFEVGGRVYSREDIERDAQARLQLCRKTSEQLKFEEKLLSRLQDSETECEAQLAHVRQLRQEQAAEIELLKGRVAYAELQKELHGLTERLGTASESETQLGQSIAQLQKQVRRIEHDAHLSGDVPVTPSLVDYADHRRQRTADEIAEFLDHRQPESAAMTAGTFGTH